MPSASVPLTGTHPNAGNPSAGYAYKCQLKALLERLSMFCVILSNCESLSEHCAAPIAWSALVPIPFLQRNQVQHPEESLQGLNSCLAAQVRCGVSGPNTNSSGDFTRRDVVVAGALGAAGSQLAYSGAPAVAATQDEVKPVNISAKETMQLGKSGMFMTSWSLSPPINLY